MIEIRKILSIIKHCSYDSKVALNGIKLVTGLLLTYLICLFLWSALSFSFSLELLLLGSPLMKLGSSHLI